MRNAELWRPTKYVYDGTALRGSGDRSELAVGSRLVGDLVAKALGRAVKAHARGRVLDLGCGRVPLFAVYKSQADSVTCVDWPSSFHGDRHVDVFCDVGRRLPLRQAVADTVVSSDVLEHLADPRTAFEEFARVLAPGGVLVLNTPFLYRVHEAPHDYLRHTRYSLEHLTRASGLDVVEIVAIGGLIDVVVDNLAKGLASVPMIGRALSSWLQRLTLWFGGTRPGRLARRSTCGEFPLGHVLVARRAPNQAV